MKDSELLRLLRRDPYRGMNALTECYAGLLYAVVRARLPESVFGSSEVEDAVADTFSAFYLSLDRFRPQESSIRSYLCVMARNRAADVLRKSRIIPLPLDGEEAEDSLDVAGDVEEDELRARLLSEIKRLGEPDSAILIRKYFLGQSAKDIASALGLTASNVDTRAHRAIRKLKEIFRGEYA